jgi:general secretion pathway protein E/type IV pilus assembly protein PilB
MRLLSKDAAHIDIGNLGFFPEQLNDFLEAIRKPNGIVLISGPTGSGKTTTLYATLRILNKEHSNILTIEDPIEYTLEGINQVQLKESIGLTFASALRTFLRQDPDIIMLGEIRDGETAQMAIRAALTGHLVLSTIHTNSAWGTISRLIDMGVPPFLLANTINLTVAQRLIRLLCTACKKEVEIDESLFPKNYQCDRELLTHFTAQGCESCFYTGYRGRKALYEVIPLDEELTDSMKSGSNIYEILKRKNIRSLSDSAFELIGEGITSIEECYPLLMNQN